MGYLYNIHCYKCGYDRNIGAGSSFFDPSYEELQEAGKRGEYGVYIREFLVEHPDGVIDFENVIVKCEKCKEFYTVTFYKMLIPKDSAKHIPKESKKWQDIVRTIISNVFPFLKSYVDLTPDSDSKYQVYDEFLEHCGICGSSMEIILDEAIITFFILLSSCPHCGRRFLIVKWVGFAD